MRMLMTRTWAILKETAVEWYEDEAQQQAAALACYTLLSLAPLILFSIAIASVAFGEEAARGQIAEQLSNVVGPAAANAIEGITKNAHQSNDGLLSTLVGFAVLLFGASGVFGELQTSLNRMWEVKPKPGLGFKGFLRTRFFSFTMVLGVAFLLLVSLLVSTALAAAGRYLSGALPGGEVVWDILNLLISLGVISALFALLFKYVPDAEIRWRDVWVGAFGTSLLFTLGKWALALYLGRSSVASSYGAAGSLVALVIWVYYASQIVFVGAELTQVYARRIGGQIRPSAHAVEAPAPSTDTRREPSPADLNRARS